MLTEQFVLKRFGKTMLWTRLSVQLMALAMHRVRFRLQVLQESAAGRQRCHVYLWHTLCLSKMMGSSGQYYENLL